VKTRRAETVLSHWWPFDTPVTNGTVQAACGKRVTEKELARNAALPTCGRCCEEYLEADLMRLQEDE